MDNKKSGGIPDKYHINISNKYEIEYWSIKLGVSSTELLEIVKLVGTSSLDVKKYLKEKE
ncbi:MAG: DUF3606 domain-containing protein [Mucilaginibacter sp.]